jgi:hypothetical protein
MHPEHFDSTRFSSSSHTWASTKPPSVQTAAPPRCLATITITPASAQNQCSSTLGSFSPPRSRTSSTVTPSDTSSVVFPWRAKVEWRQRSILSTSRMTLIQVGLTNKAHLLIDCSTAQWSAPQRTCMHSQPSKSSSSPSRFSAFLFLKLVQSQHYKIHISLVRTPNHPILLSKFISI